MSTVKKIFSGMLRPFLLSGLRIALAVGAFFFSLWWFGGRMPGKSRTTAAPLRGATFLEDWPALGTMSAMAVFLFCVCALRFRKKIA